MVAHDTLTVLRSLALTLPPVTLEYSTAELPMEVLLRWLPVTLELSIDELMVTPPISSDIVTVLLRSVLFWTVLLDIALVVRLLVLMMLSCAVRFKAVDPVIVLLELALAFIMLSDTVPECIMLFCRVLFSMRLLEMLLDVMALLFTVLLVMFDPIIVLPVTLLSPTLEDVRSLMFMLDELTVVLETVELVTVELVMTLWATLELVIVSLSSMDLFTIELLI